MNCCMKSFSILAVSQISYVVDIKLLLQLCGDADMNIKNMKCPSKIFEGPSVLSLLHNAVQCCCCQQIILCKPILAGGIISALYASEFLDARSLLYFFIL